MADGRRLTRNQSRNINNCEMKESLMPANARQLQCPYCTGPGFGFSANTKQFSNRKNKPVSRTTRKTRQSSRCESTNWYQYSQLDKKSQDIRQCKVGVEHSLSRVGKDRCFNFNCVNDLEMDTVVTSDVRITYLDQSPDGIEKRLPEMEPDGMRSLFSHVLSRRKPIKKGLHDDTPIRIIHEYQDSEQGDEFGVTLRTYETVIKGETIRQHFLVDVESKGPADKMRIKNEDELALLNGIFVPEKTHRELIDIFHHVKVDGKTKLTLVIRRIQNQWTRSCKRPSKTERTFQWMETSAILAPDYKKLLDDQPVVKDCHHRVFHTPDYFKHAVPCRYRTMNRNLYIDINKQGQLIANKESSHEGDQTKILLKHGRCYNDAEGNLSFDAALSDNEGKFYINIKNGTVTLESSRDWFKIGGEGTKTGAHGREVVFMKNNLYLACDEESGQMTTSPTIYRFTEIGVNHGYDTIDSGTRGAKEFPTNEANNPPKSETRQNMSLFLGPIRTPACTQGNGLDSTGNSSMESIPSDMETDICDSDTSFYTQPNSLKTPTTPMEALCIHK